MSKNVDMPRAPGRATADQDWANEKAVVLTGAEIFSRAPVIHACGLYLVMSGEGGAYVREYNKRIRELLAEQGLPDWAPRTRLIPAEQLATMLDSGLSFDSFIPESTDEERLVRQHVRLWSQDPGGSPATFVRVTERALLALGGPMPDVNYKFLLTTVTLPHRRCSQSPSFS